MIKCCRWCFRTNIIVLIWVSVVLLFHKCLRLRRLGLYTVCILRVNNDAAIVTHVCYINLLTCNYYHEYLACAEEDFLERYILLEVDWELLSGEHLVILLKLLSYSLVALERRSQFRSRVMLFPKINRYIFIFYILHRNEAVNR